MVNGDKREKIDETFEVGGRGCLGNRDIFERFKKAVSNNLSWSKSDIEILRRVGNVYQPVSIDVQLYPTYGRDSKLVRLANLSEFAKTAIEEAQNYRIIHEDAITPDIKGNYKLFEDIPTEKGIYVMTYQNSPKFKVDIEARGDWITGYMIFKSLEAECTTQCLPNFEKAPYKHRFITHVPTNPQSEIESSMKHIFHEFHSSLKSRYV